MEWIKINKYELIPCGNLLVTNGKEIGVQYEGINSSIISSVKNWTHYRFIDDAPLLNQPERSKREDLDCNKCDKYLKCFAIMTCRSCLEILSPYIDRSKMRCSEHCGNTVRDK